MKNKNNTIERKEKMTLSESFQHQINSINENTNQIKLKSMERQLLTGRKLQLYKYINEDAKKLDGFKEKYFDAKQNYDKLQEKDTTLSLQKKHLEDQINRTSALRVFKRHDLNEHLESLTEEIDKLKPGVLKFEGEYDKAKEKYEDEQKNYGFSSKMAIHEANEINEKLEINKEQLKQLADFGLKTQKNFKNELRQMPKKLKQEFKTAVLNLSLETDGLAKPFEITNDGEFEIRNQDLKQSFDDLNEFSRYAPHLGFQAESLYPGRDWNKEFEEYYKPSLEEPVSQEETQEQELEQESETLVESLELE